MMDMYTVCMSYSMPVHTAQTQPRPEVKLWHSAAVHAAYVDASCAAAGAAAKVLLACDTRPSSPALLAAAAAGVQALGGVALDCGRLTTPQLHWQLRRLNQGLPWALQDYFCTLAGAYEQLVKGTDPLEQVSPNAPCLLKFLLPAHHGRTR